MELNPKERKRLRGIYHAIVVLLNNSRTINSKMFGYRFSFSSKMRSFEIMYRETLQKSSNLREAYETEHAGKTILMPKTSLAWSETITYFEAYLNATYSLLQILAKIAVCFYEKIDPEKCFNDNFGGLIEYIKTNPHVDPEFCSYIRDNLSWYKTLRNNRHMITHEGMAFLGFGKDGEVVFVDYPKKGFSWNKEDKSIKDLERYLADNFSDLFNFLEFYETHFRQKLDILKKTELLPKPEVERLV